MNILIDMNLSPEWAPVLVSHGFNAVHWSTIGDPRAEDRVLMQWAIANNHVVFTHDLDFGATLALTNAEGPSVIQARTQDVTPAHLQAAVVAVLRDCEAALTSGALVVLDEGRARIRILPLRKI